MLIKRFKAAGVCNPEKNYMVDLGERVQSIIERYIKNDEYFTINRARQYGKSTTLTMLERALKDEYLVIKIKLRENGERGSQKRDTFYPDIH